MAKTKRSNNKIIFYLIGLIFVLLVIAFVGKTQGWIGGKKGIEVEMTEVFRATIIEKVSASGAVQPVVEVKISPEVPGEIMKLSIEEGDSVSKGDFLLKIRPDNFESALQRQTAVLNQQKANHRDSKARMARATASFIRAELEYKRQKKLFEQKVTSSADFELAEANYNIAKQDLESSKQNVEAAGFAIESSMASVREAKENLRLTEIKAPMTGIVSKLSVELGETVVGTSQMQGTEMLRIADLSNMEVRVDVNENDIIRIQLGDTAIIDVDSYSYKNITFKGVVTQIANSANSKASSDAVTEFEVRVKILNESYQDLINENGMKYPFRPGMTASVDIITETKKNVLSAPLSSVTTRKVKEDKDQEKQKTSLNEEEVDEVVFIVKDDKAIKTIVKTGISDFDNIEILDGLDEKDIIVKGPFLAVSKRLKDQDSVKEKEIKKEDEEED